MSGHLHASNLKDVFKTFHWQKITFSIKLQKITYSAVFNHICIHDTLFPCVKNPCIFY